MIAGEKGTHIDLALGMGHIIGKGFSNFLEFRARLPHIHLLK